MRLDYTVPTEKTYAEAVAAVVDTTAEHGFRVQFVHDVAGTIQERGFDCDPATIVEICNAKFASQVLARDVLIGLMLPCPVMVWEKDGVVSISTMRPTLIGGFFPEAQVDEIAAEVEAVIFAIVDEAAA
jgi:uncharacterized protein (DUF302 family)